MCSLFCTLGFLLCLGHVPWPRAFTITVLNIVFCFSAHEDITHLSSLWFIPLLGTSLVWLLNLFFVLFMFGELCSVRMHVF